MIDALFEPQSVAVLGGTSEIARGIIRQLPRKRLSRIVLAGRDEGSLLAATSDLQQELTEGSPAKLNVTTTHFDAADVDHHADQIGQLFEHDVDIIIMAFGLLGEQPVYESDTHAAVRTAQVNYVGSVSAGLEIANHLRRQGHGRLVVLSSVAGDRARRSNFVYGSTKAGTDAFAQGLGDALQGSGAQVLVVRPGFVHTRMTAGLDPAPFSVTPDEVGRDTVAALKRGAHTVYSPRKVRYVMTALKALPRPIFRRIPG